MAEYVTALENMGLPSDLVAKLLWPQRLEFPDQVQYRVLGTLHNHEGPAVVVTNSSGFRNSALFREYGRDHEGPVDTMRMFMRRGRFHNSDGPAIVDNIRDASVYLQRGVVHRVGGPAYTGNSGGDFFWYENGQKHREDGPAVGSTHLERSFMWFRRGKLHRVGGPAVSEMFNGEYHFRDGVPQDKRSEYYLNYRHIPINIQSLVEQTFQDAILPLL